MQKYFLWLLALAVTLPALAAERTFDLNDTAVGQLPKGFSSVVAGEGAPGDWRVVLAAAPSAFETLTPNGTGSRRAVIAQLAKDGADEHFPLLVSDAESYGDFTFSTRFKLVDGKTEQMAGIAFRVQDEKNFYVIRASALGNNFRFYKFVDGKRSAPIGPDVAVTKNEWHEIKVACKGNEITCWYDGQALIPPLQDNSFTGGRVGFWTKSDSVAYFTDAKVVYTPKEPRAQVVARDMMGAFPRLRGLKIVAPKKGNDPASMVVLASKNPEDVGQPGAEVHRNVFTRETIFYAKGKDDVSVVVPLRDRNGESIGAVELTMETFFLQTEQNAVTRAMPIVKAIQTRIQTAKELAD